MYQQPTLGEPFWNESQFFDPTMLGKVVIYGAPLAAFLWARKKKLGIIPSVALGGGAWLGVVFATLTMDSVTRVQG